MSRFLPYFFQRGSRQRCSEMELGSHWGEVTGEGWAENPKEVVPLRKMRAEDQRV